ncbi:hypothetical protein TNCV_606891 [Trichonephila clavipes]|nr:hypothetical protein TNCV_606891 [Trichonephila clavipes]
MNRKCLELIGNSEPSLNSLLNLNNNISSIMPVVMISNNFSKFRKINKRSALLKYQSTAVSLRYLGVYFFFAFHTRWESIKERLHFLIVTCFFQ